MGRYIFKKMLLTSVGSISYKIASSNDGIFFSNGMVFNFGNKY